MTTTAYAPDLDIRASSMVVGLATELGPAVAHFSSWRRATPTFVTGLSDEAAPSLSPPRVLQVASGSTRLASAAVRR